jgi:hypothetical protein
MVTPDILQDYLDIERFADAIGKTPRTVRRLMDEPNGLPFLQLRGRRLIHIPTAQAWLLKRVRQRNPERRPRSARRR